MKRLGRHGTRRALFAGLASLAIGGAALASSWDEKVFSSHIDFDQVAAMGPFALPALIARGRDLFRAKFTTEDGAGRPKATQAIVPTKRKFGVNPAFTRTSGPDSNSCAGCHNDPVVGGSGDFVTDVFVSEGFESAQFDSTDPSFSSERHTIALMGAGLVELLAREMTAELRAERAAAIERARASQADVRQDLSAKGGPNCTFTLANKDWSFGGDAGWTTSFAAEWEKGQKFPTLAIGHYVDRNAPGSPWGTCEENSLYRPQPGDKPDYSVRTPLVPGYCALSMLFTDWNRSGTPSLRVSNDRQYYRGGEEQMWRIEPDKAPKLYGRADGWRHVSIFGMGIAEGDIDGSGYPQYALTSMGDTKIQKLDPDAGDRGEFPVYRDIAGEVGATAHIPYAGGDKRPSTGWHSEFADFNNAGLLDLFISKGNVAQMPDFAAYDPSNLLLGQFNGKFAEAGEAAGIALDRQGRGALIDDFNLDGQLDLLVVNRAAPVSLFRNLGAEDGSGGVRPMGNWTEIRLIEPNPNRNAVGAHVAVKTGTKTQMRTVQIGGGDASGHAGWIHVGLGTAERAEIRVQWPDGEWSYPYRVFANQFVVLDRTRPQAEYWYPGK